MAREHLPPAMLDELAGRFRALGEPARLAILDALHDGELSVGEICAATGLPQAGVSRHLATLHAVGWVTRRRDGNFVHYRAADDIWQICEIVCGRVRREAAALIE